MSYQYRVKPFDHQRRVFEATWDRPAFGLFWEQGCVDADTEYLSPRGWRRIADYDGGLVAQWVPETGLAKFVKPLDYVVGPCEEMLHFTGRGVDQMLTTGHRMATLTKHGSQHDVKTALDVAESLWAAPAAMQHLPARFVMNMPGSGIPLTDIELRLQVAVIADGHFPANCRTNRVTIRLKKARKIERLRLLLQGRDDVYERTSGDFVVFIFTAPSRVKKYPASWWTELNNHQRDVILDEVWEWDGSSVAGREHRVFSRHESDADLIQFLLGTTGRIASKSFSSGVWCVRVRWSRTNGYWLRGQNVKRVPAPGGKKYCFSVPSTFLLLRRNGYIFPTGNTGKTKAIIDTAAYLYEQGEIDTVVIIAPKGVHRNWITDEIPIHMPKRHAKWTRLLCWDSGRSGKWWTKKPAVRFYANKVREFVEHDGLRIVALNYESTLTDAGEHLLKEMFVDHDVLLVFDESHYLKTPRARRTMRAHALGRRAKFVRILTGTPIAKSPFDAYAQMKCLDENFWKQHGFPRFEHFKTHFGIFQKFVNGGTGQQFETCVGYRHLDQLKEMIDPVTDRVTKDDVLDLPPKLYQRRFFELTTEQRSVYKQVKEQSMAFLERGDTVTAPLALVQLLRLQQITCGFVPTDDGEMEEFDGANPRLDILDEICSSLDHPAIIWARFRREIDLIMKRLGDKAVRYDGGRRDDERAEAKRAFQAGEKQLFVGNPAAGATGLTLTAAKTVIYCSNSFNLTDRLQSEDRAHRIGQEGAPGKDGEENRVLYIDLIAPGTVDEHIVRALRDKRDIASTLTGDELKEWI